MINVLRLIQIFIAKSETFTRKITEQNNLEAVRSLLQILHGPGIRLSEYSGKVYYFVLVILRQMIKYQPQAKDEIIKDSKSLEAIIQLIRPENLDQISEDFEINVYLFLVQLVREDIENKNIVGRLIFPQIFHRRLSGIIMGNE